jgi:hypothetical protein
MMDLEIGSWKLAIGNSLGGEAGENIKFIRINHEQ